MREFCNTWITNISLIILKVLQENTTRSMKYMVEWNGEYEGEIKEGEKVSI